MPHSSCGADVLIRLSVIRQTALSSNVKLNLLSILLSDFPNTNGWQNWETAINKINLTPGLHTLRLQALSDGFNLNWIHIGDGGAGIDDDKTGDKSFNVFPNPGNGNYTIRTGSKIAELRVFNLLGIQVAVLPFSTSVNLENLAPGIYFLKAFNGKGNEVVAKRISIIK